jgi:hypothetical protein
MFFRERWILALPGHAVSPMIRSVIKVIAMRRTFVPVAFVFSSPKVLVDELIGRKGNEILLLKHMESASRITSYAVTCT